MSRPGRHAAWVKHKARHAAEGILISVHQDRDGHWRAACDVEGRHVYATAGPAATELIGQPVTLVYSRVDADGGLRETRLTTASG
jgi:hypothetical protein